MILTKHAASRFGTRLEATPLREARLGRHLLAALPIVGEVTLLARHALS